MEPDEVAEFGESVARTVSRYWPRAADAATGDLTGLWGAGAAQGWFELGPADALGAALEATRRLGRMACPLPVMDGFVATRLLHAEDKLVAQISAGELRVLVAPGRSGERGPAYLDGARSATHVLTLPPGRRTACLSPVAGCRDLPGLAVPAWAEVDLGPAGEAFRGEVHAFLTEHADPDVLVPAMAGRGWFGLGWPASAGGRDASLAEQVVLHEEVTYARAPVTLQLGSVMLLGNSILRHGTQQQKDAFLPLIRAGELRFCLGYSEPEAGSDLASLSTRADRDGDGWVINGQKLWSTGGHLASHVWLATRTDQNASPRHAGITVFLIPMDTPGITVQPHRALSGEISCTVFYDDVRVPDSARVGAVNGGWKVITDALAGERVLMGGIAASLLRQLDELLAVVRADPDTWVGPRVSARRGRLGELAVTLQASRALVAAAIGATAGGGGTQLEAPMAGVLGGELAEAFGEAMLDILGPRAALSADVPGVPGGGAFEYGLRLSIMYVVGGGTNDIQRGLIARGLGLPR